MSDRWRWLLPSPGHLGHQWWLSWWLGCGFRRNSGWSLVSQLCALYLHLHHGGGLETGLHLLGTDSRVHEVRLSMSKLDNHTFLWGFFYLFYSGVSGLWNLGGWNQGLCFLCWNGFFAWKCLFFSLCLSSKQFPKGRRSRDERFLPWTSSSAVEVARPLLLVAVTEYVPESSGKASAISKLCRSPSWMILKSVELWISAPSL